MNNLPAGIDFRSGWSYTILSKPLSLRDTGGRVNFESWRLVIYPAVSDVKRSQLPPLPPALLAGDVRLLDYVGSFVDRDGIQTGANIEEMCSTSNWNLGDVTRLLGLGCLTSELGSKLIFLSTLGLHLSQNTSGDANHAKFI